MSNETMATVCGIIAIVGVGFFLLALMLDIDWLYGASLGLGLLAVVLSFGGALGLYWDPEPVQLVCKLIDGDYYCKA